MWSTTSGTCGIEAGVATLAGLKRGLVSRTQGSFATLGYILQRLRRRLIARFATVNVPRVRLMFMLPTPPW
jgi:hypothetical protein